MLGSLSQIYPRQSTKSLLLPSLQGTRVPLSQRSSLDLQGPWPGALPRWSVLAAQESSSFLPRCTGERRFDPLYKSYCFLEDLSWEELPPTPPQLAAVNPEG